MQDKQALRQELRKRRLQLSSAQRRAQQLAVVRVLHRHPVYRNARCIGAYRAMGSELQLGALLTLARKEGKRIVYPVLRGKHMVYSECPVPARGVRRHGVAQGALPRRTRIKLDLVLVPLLGYDDQGNRLGQGGGFYDRHFGRPCARRTRLIGIGFSEQRVPQLPREAWDVPLDGVATPKGMHFFGNDRQRWATGY